MIYGVSEECIPGNIGDVGDLRAKVIARREAAGFRVAEIIPCVCQLGEQDTRPADYFSSLAAELTTDYSIGGVDTIPATSELAEAAGFAGLGCVAVMIRQ